MSHDRCFRVTFFGLGVKTGDWFDSVYTLGIIVTGFCKQDSGRAEKARLEDKDADGPRATERIKEIETKNKKTDPSQKEKEKRRA